MLAHEPNGRTQLIALFGGQLNRSPSPATHTRWARALHKEIQYAALQADDESAFLSLAEGLMRSPHFLGANITNPFKQAAFKIRDIHADDRAIRCGAGNTLYRSTFSEGARWTLTNTDLLGCSASLEKIFNETLSKTDPLTIVILGAGAMAQTCLQALEDLLQPNDRHIEVWIVSRSAAQGLKFILRPQFLDISDPQWPQTLRGKTQSSLMRRLLCINTLPSGTSVAAATALLASLESLERLSHWSVRHLFCVTYGLQSWHQQAQKSGWNVLNGDLLFETQARASFKLWMNCDAPNLPTALPQC